MVTKIDSKQIILDEQANAPATPATGKVALYAKADGNLYQKDDTGLETQLGGSGGGMTSFTAAGDSGTPQTITDGNTLTIAGGTGLSSVASATDTVTLNLDVPVTADHGGTGQTSYASGDLLYATGATTLSKLPIGTNGQVLSVVSGAPAWSAGGGGGISVAELRYEVAQNTAGQSIPATTWTTITLNTEVSDPDNIVTIGGNQFTPIAGTYLIWAAVQAGSVYGTRQCTARLQNVTTSNVVARSTNSQHYVNNLTAIVISAAFTTTGSDAFAVQLFADAGVTVGTPINNATVGNEIYMSITLLKIG